jgi:hypothetical protein
LEASYVIIEDRKSLMRLVNVSAGL